MSLPRRLGRLARGFVSGIGGEERSAEPGGGRDAYRESRGESPRQSYEEADREAQRDTQGGETRREFDNVRRAFRAAWRGASEEWRERTEASRARRSDAPESVRKAYATLDLRVDSGMESADRARRELVKKYHPDRFSEADKRQKAEQVTAEINAAHDTVRRYLMRKREL